MSLFSIEADPVVQILARATWPGQKIYLVGGAVRDLLLNRPGHDLDFCLSKPILPVVRELAEKLNAAFYPLDEERETYRVVEIRPDGSHLTFDLAAFRGEDLIADLEDRDFTINAMALDLHEPGSLVDPLGGAQDLKDKILRVCSPKAFSNDSLRVLRAVRQSVQFGLRIEPESLGLLKKAIPGLQAVSMERQRDEFLKMLSGMNPTMAFRIMDQLGILETVFPEFQEMKGIRQSAPHTLDVWEHTLATLGELERVLDTLAEPYQAEKHANLWMGMASQQLGRYRVNLEKYIQEEIVPERSRRSLVLLGALLHDCGKPSALTTDGKNQIHFYGHETESAEIAVGIARRMKLSENETDFLEGLVLQHMRVHHLANPGVELSRRATYRFFKAAGDTAPAIILHSLADMLATYGVNLTQETWLNELVTCRQLLKAWYEEPTLSVKPSRFVTGDDIIQVLGIQPGREIGQMLAIIEEKQACGEIQNRQEVLNLLPQIYRDVLLAQGDANGREVENS